MQMCCCFPLFSPQQMVPVVLQERQEQNMAGQPAAHLQVWHGWRFLGVRSDNSLCLLALLHCRREQSSKMSLKFCKLSSFFLFFWQSSALFTFRLYNHIQLSSNLMSGCDYSLFKVSSMPFLKGGGLLIWKGLLRPWPCDPVSPQDGIEPMWEDERNKRGGRWLITLNKQQRRLDLDRFWLETVRHLTILP